MTDMTLAKKMAIIDPASWADVNSIQLQKGVWSFKDRAYLIEPMQAHLREAPRRRCFMKATQMGFSELHILKILWGLIHKYYPAGVLYLFPTKNDVGEFSKARFGPLIRANPTAIGQYVKDVASKTDTVSLKKVGDAFLYLRGGSLTKHMEAGVQESAALRGITVDGVVYDELDLMDEDVIPKAEGRMGDSEIAEQSFISNPVLPDKGIASLYDQSDQRHWFRTCLKCGYKTCAELEFPDLIGQKNGKGYVACKKCGKPTDPRYGSWVPAVRDNSDYMWGYQLSQLTSVNRDPYQILEEYTNPPDGNLGDIVRLKLGLPYVSSEDKLTSGQVLSCCGSEVMRNGHPGPCAMGVDVKRHKNVVIGIRVGEDRYQVLRVARIGTGIEAWTDILQMAKRFNVRSAVVDIRPYEDAARQFQKQAPFKTWLCQYSESTPMGTQYNSRSGIVTVNRTEILDATHRLISNERQLELPASCPEVKQFALECSSIAKVAEVNKKTGQSVFRYHKLSTNPDDYRHALNYFYLAASGGRVATVGGSGRRTSRPRFAKNEYARC